MQLKNCQLSSIDGCMVLPKDFKMAQIIHQVCRQKYWNSLHCLLAVINISEKLVSKASPFCTWQEADFLCKPLALLIILSYPAVNITLSTDEKLNDENNSNAFSFNKYTHFSAIVIRTICNFSLSSHLMLVYNGYLKSISYFKGQLIRY